MTGYKDCFMIGTYLDRGTGYNDSFIIGTH